MKHSALRWLYAVPGGKKVYIVFLALVQAAYGASGVFYALMLRGVVDCAASGDEAGFWRWILYTAALVAAQLALHAVIRWLSEFSRANFENIFKLRLTETLLEKDYLRVSAVHSGQWLNRLTNDTVVTANAYVEILPGLAGMIVKMIGALIMLVILEPRFAAILIPAGAVFLLFTWLFRRVMKRLHKQVQEADGRVRIFLQERLGSMLMIRSFAAQAQTKAQTRERLQAHLRARMKRIRFSNLCNIGFSAAMSGLYLLGIGWCAHGILVGTITFGTLTAVTQLIAQIQSPFANITGYLPRYYAMLASAERLMEAERFPRTDEHARPVEEMQALYEDSLASFGLRDVTFAYWPVSEEVEDFPAQKLDPCIRGLSLAIGKGEFVAFTGHSGCGKSTALKLLMGVYTPDAGRRYYTDAQGKETALDASYSRLFAYVPQGNLLMSGTIREVVSFARPELARDDGRIREALRAACAEEFVPDLDMPLGERGMSLSEGQMQRVAVARAIFSGSPVLLLDEATSALDADTERRLLENLRALRGKTVVIVTHRLSALEVCDRQIAFTEEK